MTLEQESTCHRFCFIRITLSFLHTQLTPLTAPAGSYLFCSPHNRNPKKDNQPGPDAQTNACGLRLLWELLAQL